METSSEKAVLRSARTMSGVLLLAAVGLAALALTAVVWMFTAPQNLVGLIGAAGGRALDEMSVGQHIALLGLGLLSLLGWALALWWAHMMFATLAKGTPHIAARLARRIAIVLWALFVWQVMAPALGSLISTLHLPDGQRSISISLGLGQAGTLLSALIASSMAKALQFGAELWQDHKEII